MGAAIVDQVAVQVLVTGHKAAQVDQLAVQLLVTGYEVAEIHQVAIQLLVTKTPLGRAKTSMFLLM